MLICNSFESRNSRFTLQKLKSKFFTFRTFIISGLARKYQYRNYSDNHLLVNHRRDTVSWPIHVNWSRYRPIFFMEINRFAVKEPRHLSPSYSPDLVPEKCKERKRMARTDEDSKWKIKRNSTGIIRVG